MKTGFVYENELLTILFPLKTGFVHKNCSNKRVVNILIWLFDENRFSFENSFSKLFRRSNDLPCIYAVTTRPVFFVKWTS